MNDAIVIWNRREGRYENENVYNGGILRWAYGSSAWGAAFREVVLVRRWFSHLYGWLHERPRSQRKIAPFIQQYRIPSDEFEPGPYRSFNDYFIRSFRPGMRRFDPDADRLCAFAEGRYLAFPTLSSGVQVPVKGVQMDLDTLLGADAARSFHGGPCLIARLAPVDYHRFHFPDDGDKGASWRLGGRLDSVHPYALRRRPRVLLENERHVTLLESANFGRLACVEVGAMGVGRIVQTHAAPSFARGEEKGYFLFGGSTVILVGQPGTFTLDDELVRQTELGFETFVRLGEPVGGRQGRLP